HEEVIELGSVEGDDRDALEVARQQRVVGLDVDLLERVADALEDGPRLVAQMAARAAVEDEAHGSSRSPLAYASRSANSRSGVTQRAAEPIIAALSVHSARSGTRSSTPRPAIRSRSG